MIGTSLGYRRWLLVLCLFGIGQLAYAQLEATAPGMGRLFADVLLYQGKRIAAGMPRDEVAETLGKVRVLGKAERTSSTKLAAHLGLLVPAIADRITLKCGVCWMEIIEKTLGKNEALRVVLMGPERDQLRVACLILDKTANSYARDMDGVWEGSRDVYLGESAVRLKQDRNGISVEPLDLGTGSPLPPDPQNPPPPPSAIKARLRRFIA